MKDRFWYQLGTFFALVLVFEIWERLRPARDGFEWRNTLLLRGPQRLDVAW